MNIENYLQDIEEQAVQEESKILVVENPVVEELCRTYELWNGSVQTGDSVYVMHSKSCVCIGANKFPSRDIKAFSLALKKYEEWFSFYRAGVFLSALINTSEEKNFDLLFGLLEIIPNWIGCFLDGKNVNINGKATQCLGYAMSSGKIEISGSAGYQIGAESTGGEIHVSGAIGRIHPACKAKIYQKGELVWPK